MPEHEDVLMARCCCGRFQSVDKTEKSDQPQGEFCEYHAIRLQKTISLRQDPRARLGLRLGLIFIVLLSVFGFTFFSLYFDPISPGPLPVIFDNSTADQTVLVALDTLQHYNLIQLRL